MCIFRTPSMPAQQVPATPLLLHPLHRHPLHLHQVMGTAVAANNPVMQNVYDPSNPESGLAEEKGATLKKAQGTSQLRIDLDPVIANMAKQTGLQINK